MAVRNRFDGDAGQIDLRLVRGGTDLVLGSDEQWSEQSLVADLDGGKDGFVRAGMEMAAVIGGRPLACLTKAS